jgi:hypothetical protein
MQHLSPENAESYSAGDPAGLHGQSVGRPDVRSLTEETF